MQVGTDHVREIDFFQVFAIPEQRIRETADPETVDFGGNDDLPRRVGRNGGLSGSSEHGAAPAHDVIPRNAVDRRMANADAAEIVRGGGRGEEDGEENGRKAADGVHGLLSGTAWAGTAPILADRPEKENRKKTVRK